MLYTTYGKTGETVSALGMGGMRFNKDIAEEECVNFIRYAHHKGINYFDTAPFYNEDRSEDIYGRAFAGMDREKFFIATKGINGQTGEEMLASIERSVERMGVQYIDFFFLWCIMSDEQYTACQLPGAALSGIQEAKKRGLVRHIGVSTHTYSDTIKRIVDDGLFEFIMIPYNAINFAQREEGLQYAKQHGMGTAVMNPMYGGVIAQYRDKIKIYPDSKRSAVEDAMNFCLQSPYIDVTLSGMNSLEVIDDNCRYAARAHKVSGEEQKQRQAAIRDTFEGMCTSCGYCLKHCPQGIDIKSYMEVYNAYELTHSSEATAERHTWFTSFGPLAGKPKAAACEQCYACESACTQYLNIVDRLGWIDEKYEAQ